MAKSQVELIGITFVVVLVLILFLFVVSFMLKAPPAEEVAELSLLGDAWLTALLEYTHPDCPPGTSIRELFVDCVKYGGTETEFRCNGKTSCEIVNQSFEYALDSTFSAWKSAFYINFTKAGWVLGNVTFGQKCPGKKEAARMPVPIWPDWSAVIHLELCY